MNFSLAVTLVILCFATSSAAAGFGDVNDSGRVDAVDVQLVINAALGIVEGPQFDIDDSGRVNAVDVQMVINAALGIVPGAPQISPVQGAPGSKVTVTGEGFDSENVSVNLIFFGDIQMPVIGASETVLTTSVPITEPGPVTVRVEVDGSVVADGLEFEILPLPELQESPGTVVAGVQKDIGSIAAEVGTVFDRMLPSMAGEESEVLGQALDMMENQISAIGALRNHATEDEKVMVDQILMSSGLADSIAGTQTEFAKRMAKLAEIDAELSASGEVVAYAKGGIPARYRFTLDWLAARLHHGMEYANVAMMGMGALAGGMPALAGPTSLMSMFASFLNGVYTVIELTPMQLSEESMTGRVGESDNTIATESSALVVFEGTFEPETSVAKTLFGLFFSKFAERLGLPSIVTAVLQSLSGDLVTALEGELDIPSIPPETNVPIYTYDFVGDPPTEPNPPEFNGGGIGAALAVAESVIYTGENESEGTIPLIARQKVYTFKGSFWLPHDQPRVETWTEIEQVDVRVKKGLKVTIEEPSTGTNIDAPTVRVKGRATKWDGSPVDDAEVTVTVTSGGSSTVVSTSDGGSFEQDVPVSAGEDNVTVTVTDGETTATAGIVIFNRALPATYCVVANVNDSSLSLIDPSLNEEMLRLTAESGIDAPYESVFMPDGETLVVLNRPGSGAFLSTIQILDLENISVIGSSVQIGQGWATSMSLTTDGETVVIPYRDFTNDIYAVHVIDVRQPGLPRAAGTVAIPSFDEFDDYSPRGVDTGVAADGRTVALVTTGYFKDGGPGRVAVLDITNPYNSTVLGTVTVTSRAGSVQVVPGTSLAVVAGISSYDENVEQRVDSAVDIIDFSDPENVTVRDSAVYEFSWFAGLAVTPDGMTALVANAGEPLSPTNSMVFMDISDPDDMFEMTDISPLPFDGTGSPRIDVSPDGDSAVVTSHLADVAVGIDLPLGGAPVANEGIMTGDYPWGVTFRP